MRNITNELTPGEQAVYEMIALGFCTKEVAQKLGKSERTVKFHVGNIYDKTGLHSRAELAARFHMGEKQFHQARANA